MEVGLNRAVHAAGEVSATSEVGRGLRLLGSIGKSRYSSLKRTPLAGTRGPFTAQHLCHQVQGWRKWESGSVAAALSRSSTATRMERNARELVDALLSLVEASDRGTMLTDQEQGQVEHIIRSLEQQCMPEPLKSPLLFGEWDVVYSSNPTATGGYYRSAIGRSLLKTKQMMQIVKEPDFVSNKVSFAALGILDGEVSLKGKLEAIDDKWIKINFESPYLKFGPIEFQYGGGSEVKIAVIYLDDRVRLGRGSRGSLFVFKRR